MKKKKKASLAYRQERRGAVPHFAKKLERSKHSEASAQKITEEEILGSFGPPPAYILLYIYIYIYNNAPLPFFIA